MPDLTYSENDREHVNFADSLGQLQGQITKGSTTKDTAHSYYMGAELLVAYPGSKSGGEYFLKIDGVGSGKSKDGRSTNRIIVKVDANGTLIENTGWVWRHDNRVMKLSAGFFTRALVRRPLYS